LAACKIKNARLIGGGANRSTYWTKSSLDFRLTFGGAVSARPAVFALLGGGTLGPQMFPPLRHTDRGVTSNTN
jgi:hypothetical protein